MRILLINAEQDERLFATFKHEHILYDQQPESDTLDISENIYDVIVYNATKLDEKTVDAVRSLRESGDMTPLLVMAGHTTARARIRILNAGADNVLMRPCQSDEILAHVNALARRPRMMQSEILTAGDLTLDRGRCVLSSNDGEVRLSGKELQLVEMFLREPGQVNVAGGMRIHEPALDLGIILALLTSYRNQSLDDETICFGEVGLAGEVRAVNMAEQRVLEAAKLGFKRCILPKVNCRQLALTKEQTRGLELVGIESIHELLEVF